MYTRSSSVLTSMAMLSQTTIFVSARLAHLVHVWETVVDPWSAKLVPHGSWLERHLGADRTAV